MKNRLEIKGLKKAQQDLLQLPNSLAVSALDVVNTRARETADEIRRAYPRKTGNLRSSVKVERGKKSGTRRLAVASATIKVGSPVAHLIEDGTVARHTSLGPEYGNRGQLYGQHVFWPRVLRLNRDLQPEFVAIARAQGLKVTGRG